MTLSPKLEPEPEDDFLEETLLEEEDDDDEEEEEELMLLADEEGTAATEDFLAERDCEREALVAGFFFGRATFLVGSGDFEAARRLTLLGDGDGEGTTFFFGPTAVAFLATVFLAEAAGFLAEEDLEEEAAGFLGVADFLEEAFLGEEAAVAAEAVRFFAGTDDFLVAGAILCFILYSCVCVTVLFGCARFSFFFSLTIYWRQGDWRNLINKTMEFWRPFLCDFIGPILY